MAIENHSHSGLGGDGEKVSAINLANFFLKNIKDVDVDGIADGEGIKWDEALNKFVAGSFGANIKAFGGTQGSAGDVNFTTDFEPQIVIGAATISSGASNRAISFGYATATTDTSNTHKLIEYGTLSTGAGNSRITQCTLNDGSNKSSTMKWKTKAAVTQVIEFGTADTYIGHNYILIFIG